MSDCAGANVIPLDIYHSTRTEQRMRSMIDDAVAVHMNMLRLWGGGLPYFPDSFYDMCDKAGILVWQEASFACALYPRDDAFLDEVSMTLGKGLEVRMLGVTSEIVL